MFTKNTIKTDLNILLSATAALIIIGALFIYSSSSVFALAHYGSAHFFLKKQLIGFSIGLIALLIASLVPLEMIKGLSPFLFIGSICLTILTLIGPFALKIHGSSRWISYGPLNFQPSELLKLSFIIYVAHFLGKKQLHLNNFKKGFLPFIFLIAFTCLILLAQPDFGMAVTLATTALFLFFIAAIELRHIAYTAIAALPVVVSLVIFKPYRIKRVLTFLDPWSDPQGAGFQIIQSLIAIGSGNWLGMGISHSKQKFFYLPMQHTDFIFAIIAEETGFIGSLLLISLYMLILYLGIKIAWQLTSLFSTFMVIGFTLVITLQATINLCVATGLAPTKGIGLPFVSYGNSSLMVHLLMLGLIINAVRNADYTF